MKPAVNIGQLPFHAWEQNNVTVRRDQSFIRFVLPMAFPEVKGSYRFERRAELLAGSGCWRLLGGEKQGFLPHVRMHFNTVNWHLASSSISAENALDPENAFGYIFASTGLDSLPFPSLDFSFRVPGSDRHVEVDVTGAQIGIFRLGVGFVSLEVRPRSQALPDWLDALHFLRFYGGRAEKLSVSQTTGGEFLRIEDFARPVVAAATLDSEKALFSGRGAGPPHREPGARPAHRDPRVKELYSRGEFLTYVTLFVDGLPADSQYHLLYSVLNRFRSSSQAAPVEASEERPWCLPYQGGQQFLNSIEGSAFVGFDAGRTQFDVNTLPSHLGTTYFTLFMFALLQRFALDQLSEAVAQSTSRVLTESERGHAQGELERVTGLDGRLLDFTGRCYFVQVSQTAHHHAYYAQLREVNQIEGRYREVTEEVHALRAHAGSRVSVEQERTSLRVAAALMVITVVLLPLQVIESLFSGKLPKLPGIRSLSPIWSAAAAGFVLLFALALALLILYGGRRRRRRAE